MKHPTVTRQGHWHTDSIFLTMRRRGVRAWTIDFDQKRPNVALTGYTIGEHHLLGIWNGDHHVMVGSREGSMLFRDGEDGSEYTMFSVPLPWPGFGKEWRVYTDQEKWTVTIIALAEESYLRSIPEVIKVARGDLKRWWKNRRKHDDHAGADR